ncbi:hypothetical protein ACQ4PT_060007 [Festuca glaucescens]
MEDTSAPYLQVGDEHDKPEHGADCGLELRTLCEQVRLQMENVELSLVSADTEQERRKQIPALQSIADTISCFYAVTSRATSSRSDGVDMYQYEEAAFARFRAGWERAHADNKIDFEDLTLFSPMLFTHCTPRFMPIDAINAKTVQVCSIKVTDLKHFSWPLQVHGVVAARDVVDQRRNPIFLCPRDNCQTLDESHPFLHLPGPVRAIVSEEPVDIEIQLKVKGATAAEDRALISYAFYYEGTIFGVHVVDEKLTPFEHGFKVVCYSLSQRGSENINESPPSLEVVLFDSKVGTKRGVKGGFINLSRQVVSVEMCGKLKVHIQAYSQSGDVAAEGHVLAAPKRCNTSEHELDLAGFKVVFTVAWSLLIDDEDAILINGMADPFALLPPMHPSIASLLK